jgi:hypothetical protein
MVFNKWGPHKEGSLSATQDGIVGTRGTLLALMPGREEPDFETCRAQTTWTHEITWDQVKQGSMLCIKVLDGRRGVMRIARMPNFGASNPSVTLSGQVWAPIVDG